MTGFRAPTRLHLHPGARRRIAASVQSLDARSVLLVTDPGVFATPWRAEIQKSLESAGVAVEVAQAVSPNPRTHEAEALAAMAHRHATEVVIALGGGSAMDCAKAAAMLATNPGSALQFVGKNRFTNPPLPLVAIPTTCGTGSEVTWVAVLTDPQARQKISIKGDTMFPHTALVDPDVLVGLPASIIAATGMDAMTHALEATTANCSNPISDSLAARAVVLLARYLARATTDIEGDTEARTAVMTASTLAGLAFSNADVGAVHCLSETLGGRMDVAHGVANAMLLAPTMRAHGAAVAGRLAELERSITGQPDARSPAAEAERFLGRLEAMQHKLEIPKFASLDIPASDWNAIADGAVANGSNASNPRPMAGADYLDVLQRAHQG